MKAYADTNFLARLYFPQWADPDANKLMGEVLAGDLDLVPITWLLEIEFTAAVELYVYFGRQGQRPRVTPEQAAIAHADFDTDRRDGLLYEPTDLSPARIVHQSTTLARRHTAKHGHRTYDLIHVGCAIELACSAFWTFDRRAAQLAEREGLKVPARLKSAMKKL